MLESAGVKTMLNELSSTVVFERPREEAFVRKWQLACEGDIAHVVVMPNITIRKLETFVQELFESRCVVWRGARLWGGWGRGEVPAPHHHILAAPLLELLWPLCAHSPLPLPLPLPQGACVGVGSDEAGRGGAAAGRRRGVIPQRFSCARLCICCFSSLRGMPRTSDVLHTHAFLNITALALALIDFELFFYLFLFWLVRV